MIYLRVTNVVPYKIIKTRKINNLKTLCPYYWNFLIFLLADKPSIAWKGALVVNESSVVNLTREISSNPLSNASWYDGSKLLVSEMAVNTTTLIIHAARCTDTKNFTLTASNLLQLNVTSLVELIVNCEYICTVISFFFSMNKKTP